MSLRFGIAVAAMASVLAVSSASAADLWGATGTNAYDSSSPSTDAYGYDTPSSSLETDRSVRSFGDVRQSYRETYRPVVRRVSAFDRLRYQLEKFGYTRIRYQTERTNYYGDPVYYLTACHNGVRYRLHVTSDCEIELKRRAGYCESSYY